MRPGGSWEPPAPMKVSPSAGRSTKYHRGKTVRIAQEASFSHELPLARLASGTLLRDSGPASADSCTLRQPMKQVHRLAQVARPLLARSPKTPLECPISSARLRPDVLRNPPRHGNCALSGAVIAMHVSTPSMPVWSWTLRLLAPRPHLVSPQFQGPRNCTLQEEPLRECENAARRKISQRQIEVCLLGSCAKEVKAVEGCENRGRNFGLSLVDRK